MKPIKFKGTYSLREESLTEDTDRYDRPDADEMRAASLFESFGINCLEGRRGRKYHTFTDRVGSNVPLTRPKEESSESSPPTVTVPVIPQWGPAHSGKRLETEPVAKFTFARNSTSNEIIFNPPMSTPLILLTNL
jgi:hypothetical protein